MRQLWQAFAAIREEGHGLHRKIREGEKESQDRLGRGKDGRSVENWIGVGRVEGDELEANERLRKRCGRRWECEGVDL